MFTVQCTDVWKNVQYNLRYPVSIICCCHKYLITLFYIYIYISILLTNISDIGIFLLANISRLSAPAPEIPYVWDPIFFSFLELRI